MISHRDTLQVQCILLRFITTESYQLLKINSGTGIQV